MHSKNNLKLEKGSLKVGLYSIVFFSKTSVYVVQFLFLSFLIQPVHQAMANETANEEQAEETETLEIATPANLPFDDSVSDGSEEIVDNVTSSNEEEVSDSLENDGEVELQEEGGEEVGITEEELTMQDEAENEGNNSELVSLETEPNSTTTSEEVVEDNQADAGNESEATTTEQTSDNNASSTAETTEGETSENNETATSTEIFDDEASSTSTEDNLEEETSTSSSEVTGDSGTSSEDETATSSDESDGSIVDDSTADTENEDSTDDSTAEDEVDSTENDSSQEEGVGDEIIEEGVSDIVDEVVTLTRQLVTEENYYQFSKQSCVPVGDGTFHCTEKKDLPIDLDSAVFAQQDEEGDMEIYLRNSKGDVKQLTDNQYDDTSPDVDHSAMKVVWQRLINGRYQIISYDLNDKKETQLTFSKTNSMEPKVSQEGIVWQSWDGEDWEIVFFDGQNTELITDNEIQDVTPVIEDGYILWSILGGEEQEARVYSIESGETVTITGHEGGAVANPRFVLVYDTKFENGDVVTQSFDPVTGLSAPVSAKPAELPFDIPESDPVGETRALIQKNATNDEKDIVTTGGHSANGDLNLNSTSSISSSTINISDLNNGVIVEATTTQPDFELTEFDLVITSTATSSSLEDIQDELPTVTENVASSTQ